MLRITTGTAKNKRLQVPDIEGLRPVQEVVKLAMFSIVGEKVVNATCLDLYAGSGNLGLEALSRGAKWCDFVDEHPKARDTILENLKNCGLAEKAETFLKNSGKFVKAAPIERYDLVFMDPFYEDVKHKFLLSNLGNIVKKDATILFTHGAPLQVGGLIHETKFKLETQRQFGATHLSVLGLN